MIALLLALLIAPQPQPPHVLQIRLVHSLCASLAVDTPAPIHYDAPPWDDAIGAQAGVWWTETAGVVGYSYQEDGIAYRTLPAADICPVYPES